MSTQLWFYLPDVITLAEHVSSVRAYIPSYGEQEDGEPCTGALEWVADDGIYLMSNGVPPLLSNPDDESSNVTVYAHGWGPGSGRHRRGPTAVGRDDFVEHLHLYEGSPTLADRIRRAAELDGQWMVLEVLNLDEFRIRLVRGNPPERC